MMTNLERLEELTATLVEKEEVLNAFFEQSPVGLIVADEDLNILSCNPAVLELIRCREKELVGSNVLMLIPERYRARHLAAVRNPPAISKVLNKTNHLHIVRCDGGEVEVIIWLGDFKINGSRRYIASVRLPGSISEELFLPR